MQQRVKKWRSVASNMAIELNQPRSLPPEAKDPAWAQKSLDAAWADIRLHVEIVVASGAAVIEVAEAATQPELTDYLGLKEAVHKLLRGLKPAIAAVGTVAGLDDTPGLGQSLIRRSKTMGRGVIRLMTALEARTLGTAASLAEIKAAVHEYTTACSVILGTLISVVLFDFQLSVQFAWGSALVVGAAEPFCRAGVTYAIGPERYTFDRQDAF